jgi:cation transport ATPase
LDAEFDVLELAAAVEVKSSHPLSHAIVSAYCGCLAELDKELPPVQKLKNLEGVGVEGWVSVGKDQRLCVSVGNERLLRSFGGSISLSKSDQEGADSFLQTHAGTSIIYVGVDDQLAMLLSLADQVRPEAADVVKTLQNDLCIEVCMLTGDQEEVAIKVCNEVGISSKNCQSRLLPTEKLDCIKSLRSVQPGRLESKASVMMIGDGINDSVALAGAAVGVAMGAGGSAMAAAAANIVLLSDNLARLPQTITLCRQVRQIILQNCVISIVTKIVAIGLAMAGLLQFWQAILLDVGTLLIVIANGVRPLATKVFVDKIEGNCIIGASADMGAGKEAVQDVFNVDRRKENASAN